MIQIIGVTLNTHPLDTTHTGVVRAGRLDLRGIVKPIADLKITHKAGAYLSYWGGTITQGEHRLGHFLPDHLGSFRVTHLLPIRKFPKVSKEHWDTIGSGFPYNGFHGLALDHRGGVYYRVGFFGFDWVDDDSPSNRWFDGCEIQAITLL